MVAARSVIHLNELITHSDGTQQVKMRIVSDFWRYGPSTFSVKRNCLYSSISPKTLEALLSGTIFVILPRWDKSALYNFVRYN